MVDFSMTYRDVRETLAGELPDGFTEEGRRIYLDIYGDVLNMTYEEFVVQERQKIVTLLQEEGRHEQNQKLRL